MLPKIKFILILFSSERDTSGNTYHAAKWVDISTGHTVYGTIDDPRGFEVRMPLAMGLDRSDGYIDNVTLSKREFKSFTKKMGHINYPFEIDGVAYMKEALSRGGNENKL